QEAYITQRLTCMPVDAGLVAGYPEGEPCVRGDEAEPPDTPRAGDACTALPPRAARRGSWPSSSADSSCLAPCCSGSSSTPGSSTAERARRDPSATSPHAPPTALQESRPASQPGPATDISRPRAYRRRSPPAAAAGPASARARPG